MTSQKQNLLRAKRTLSTISTAKVDKSQPVQNYDTNNTSLLKLTSPTLLPWMAMIFSIVIWYKFGSTMQAGSLGNTSNVYRIVLVIAGGILALNLTLKHSSNISKSISLPLILLFIYGLTAFFSSLIIPTNAFYTMWKSIEIIVDVMAMISIIAATRSISGPLSAYKCLMFYNVLMLLFVIAGALISPSEALRSSRGIVPFFIQGHIPILNPNTIGFISAQLIIHSFATFYRTNSANVKLVSTLVFMVSFILLIMAQSRTSTAGIALGLIVYLYLDKKRPLAIGLMVASAVIMLFTSGAEVVTQYLQRGQSEELLTSLSGRTHGWTAAWELFLQSPWFGHGFAAAARTEILGTGDGAASTLHGAVFDIIVGVGLSGFIPWTIAVLYFLYRMAKLTLRSKLWINNKHMRSIHAEMCAITIVIVIRAATSSGVSMHDHAFMLLLCLIGYSATAGRPAVK